MVKEEERAEEEREQDFKQRLFIQDPKFYADVFPPEPNLDETGWDSDEDAEMIAPIDEAEMHEALTDMRRRGLIN